MLKYGKLNLQMASNTFLTLLLYSILLMIGQALFKITAIQSTSSMASPIGLIKKLFTSPAFLSGCILHALSTILWVALLSRLQLSQAYPLVIAMSIVLTTLLGIAVFKEHINHRQTNWVAYLVPRRKDLIPFTY